MMKVRNRTAIFKFKFIRISKTTYEGYVKIVIALTFETECLYNDDEVLKDFRGGS